MCAIFYVVVSFFCFLLPWLVSFIVVFALSPPGSSFCCNNLWSSFHSSSVTGCTFNRLRLSKTRLAIFVLEGARCFQFAQGQWDWEFFYKLDSHHIPFVVVWSRFGIITCMATIPSRDIGFGGFHDFDLAHNARFFATGMIQKGFITNLHGAQDIAGLIISYSIPIFLLEAGHVLNGKMRGFGFQEKIVWGRAASLIIGCYSCSCTFGVWA